MKNRFLYGAVVCSMSAFLLAGCFGGEKEVVDDGDKVLIYNKDNAISRENKAEYDAYLKDLEENKPENIKSADYIVDTIVIKDLDNKYFYDEIFGLEVDKFLINQLKYYEVHREYMLYLERNGATQDDLLLQNRMFNSFLKTFEGRHVDKLKEVKGTMYKTFLEYNIKELQTILDNKSIKDLVKERRSVEEERKMWDYYKKELGFKKDILEETHIVFDLLKPSDKDVVERLNTIFKDVKNVVKDVDFSTKEAEIESKLEKLIAYGKELNEMRMNDEVMWIKNTVVNYLTYDVDQLNLIKNKDKYNYAYNEFLVNIDRKEQIVITELFDEGLSTQDEKRKAQKEQLENEKNEEKNGEKDKD